VVAACDEQKYINPEITIDELCDFAAPKRGPTNTYFNEEDIQTVSLYVRLLDFCDTPPTKIHVLATFSKLWNLKNLPTSEPKKTTIYFAFRSLPSEVKAIVARNSPGNLRKSSSNLERLLKFYDLYEMISDEYHLQQNPGNIYSFYRNDYI